MKTSFARGIHISGTRVGSTWIGGASVAFAISLALVGCSGPAVSAPTPTSKPSPSVTPSETPTPIPTPEALACDNIITAATIAQLEAEGFVQMEDYEDKLRTEERIEARFFDYGGVACQWGIPNSDGIAAFAYSAITDANAAEIQTILADSGYLRSEDGSDVIFRINPDGNPLGHDDTFLFEAGAWFHSNDLGGIQEIRDSVTP